MVKAKGRKKTVINSRDLPKIVTGRKKKRVVKKKKRSNRKFRHNTILPWMTDDEWNEACMLYHGSDYASILRQLLLWNLRVPSLPIEAEMTVQLVQALDFDSNDDEALPEQEFMMRTLYSLALVRFMSHINHFANCEVDGVESMTLAAQRNIPSWLVDLQREATHGVVVPSIAILRNAGEVMRKWLAEHYWIILDIPEQLATEDAEGGDLERMLYNRASEVISAYMATRIYHFREIANIQDFEITKFYDSDKLSVATDDAMMALKRVISIDVEMDAVLICCVLAREMVPIPEIYKKFGNTFPEKTFNKLKTVWNPILNLLHRKNKLVNLCHELAKMHVSTEEAYSDIEHFRYLSGRWLKIILRRIRKTGEGGKYSKELSSTVLPVITKASNTRSHLFINELLDITTSEIGARTAKQKILNDIWNDIGSNRSNTGYTFKSVEDILPDYSSVLLALSAAANG